ncbi:hypothetical protein [Actinotalea sp. Marseille-Q4924]|uniref:hypothetical protein n=1 Tax=Actinotalea sp. Marseille-Q4924 TaxID=2866571 RepID=UPI001CE3FDF7|nr:hypothetical protein [Actinotalea sp. Marseille-Q4924]
MLPAAQLSTVLRRLGWSGAAAPAPPPDPVASARVRATARRLAGPGRQRDATTCGSAALTVLAALGDPTLERWLVSGRLAGAALPPELAGAPSSALAWLADAPAAARFHAVHRVVKRRTNDGSGLGPPWPEALGTPPWGAARVARFPGVRWTHRPLDDTDPVTLRAELAGVRAWLAAGVPVPLYSGGDARQGWAAAVPRHVVLAVGVDDDVLDVFEPSRGVVVRVPTAELLVGDRPHPALGRWRHLAWVVAPVAQGSR